MPSCDRTLENWSTLHKAAFGFTHTFAAKVERIEDETVRDETFFASARVGGCFCSAFQKWAESLCYAGFEAFGQKSSPREARKADCCCFVGLKQK